MLLPHRDATHRQSLVSGRTRKHTHPRIKRLNLSIFAVSVQHVPRLSSCFFFLSLTNLICFRLKPSDYLLRQLALQPKMKCGEKDCSWGDRSEAIMTNEDVRFFFPLSLLKAFKLMIAFVRVCKMEGRWWTWKGKWETNRSGAKAERQKEEAFTFSQKNPLRCILVTILHDQRVEKNRRDISPEFQKRHKVSVNPPGVSAHAYNHDDMNMFISLYCVENPRESPQTPSHHINVNTKSPLRTGSAGAREQHCWLIKS